MLVPSPALDVAVVEDGAEVLIATIECNGRSARTQRRMEANWINRLVLNDRVSVVRVHTEVQFVRGRITALIGINRVGLILRIDRRCAANDTGRDAHASRQSRVCFPSNEGGRGIPRVATCNQNG